MLKRTNEKGFTLVELLIVIVIIGILAGLVITIINPRRMQMRSGHSIIRANVGRACQAIIACASSTTTPETSCNTGALAGFNQPNTPNGQPYPVNPTVSAQTITYANTPVAAWDNCQYTCTYYRTTVGGNQGGSSTLVGTNCIDN